MKLFTYQVVARRGLITVLLLTPLFTPLLHAEEQSATGAVPELVARVGATDITRLEFDQTLRRAMRERFYHFRPPEGQYQEFRREVADELITRKLLLQEAERRGVRADEDKVTEGLKRFERRYAGRPGWDEHGSRLLAAERSRLEEDDRLRQLEEEVRRIDAPSEQEVRDYYRENPDTFTEPQRPRVALILLKVDPSSSGEVWAAATDKATQLAFQIREGDAAFAELARQYSDDVTAPEGGDMGYLHRGMLATAAEEVIDALAVGEVSEPLRLLEGIALFQVRERQPARLLDFEAVRERALALLQQQRSDLAWTAFKKRLRQTTPVEILDPSLRPVGGT